MLKSARLALSLGIVLGLSVATLPNRSYAGTLLVDSEDTVSATVLGYLAFSAIDHAYDTNVSTYDDVTNSYIGTFSLMDSTVTCNYISDPNPDASARLSGNCSNGWTVSAESEDVSDGYAAMIPSDNAITYRIKSTDPATNPLSGTTANWLMKINGVAKTYSGSSFSTSAVGTFGNFHLIPAKNNSANVASGNTFRTVNGHANTYIGPETFEAQYGFTAGMDAVAGSYTGSVIYTLHINAS